jgi:hypothetical protein
LTSSLIPVPGVPGSNFQAMDQWWGPMMYNASINASGQCGFRHAFSATGGVRRGVFMGAPGFLTTVAVTQPSTQPQPRVTGLGMTSISDQSVIAFTRTTSVSTTSTRREVLRATPSVIMPILSTDDPVPGQPGAAYTLVGPLVGINSAETIVFGVSILGADQVSRDAVMRYENGQLQRLYSDGDVVTLADGSSATLAFVIAGQPLLLGPVVGDGGHIVFSSLVEQNGQSFNAVLRRDPNGALRIIARQGQVVQQGSPFPLTLAENSPLASTFQLNERGEVLLGMATTQLPGVVVYFAAKADGQLVALAVPGAELSLRGAQYTIGSVTTGRPPIPSGGGDGRARVWNDRSEFVYGATLTRPSQPTVTAILVARLSDGPTCDSIDFNNDGSFFDPDDVDAFFSVFSEGACIPAGATCNDIDFNNDGSLFDPQDVDAFFSVFSEGPCL